MADSNTKSQSSSNDGRGEVKNPETDGRLKENQGGSSRNSEKSESGSGQGDSGGNGSRGTGSR